MPLVTNQPLAGEIGLITVVAGALPSILIPATVLVAVLPALSVQVADDDRFAPSPVTTWFAGPVATPERASVQDQVTVTSPVCQPLGTTALSTGAVLSTLIPLSVAV